MKKEDLILLHGLLGNLEASMQLNVVAERIHPGILESITEVQSTVEYLVQTYE